MKKRTHLTTSILFISLCILMCLLTGCDTSSPTFSSTLTPDVAEQMATITALTRSSTPDPILNLVSTYTGTYHWQRSNSSSSMRLEITHQHGPGFSGDCLLGQQRYPLLQTITSPAFGLDEGGITFTIDIPASQRQQATSLHFQGSVTKDGTMTGQVSSSDGKQGIWSVQKA